MNTLKWFVIGLNLYVFPPDPEIGDMEGLKKWEPSKKGIIETLIFRFKTRTWAHSTGNMTFSRLPNNIKDLVSFKEGGYTSNKLTENRQVMKPKKLTIEIGDIRVTIKQFGKVYRIDVNFRPSEYPELTRFLESEFHLTNIHNNATPFGGFYCLEKKVESLDIVAVLTAGVNLFVNNCTPVDIIYHGKA